MHEDLREYDATWSDLNRKLDAVVASGLGLDAALRALHDQQISRGFIRDDLTQSRRYFIRDPTHSDRHFSAQYNPARAKRFQGAGKKQPPPGAVSLNKGCFLCRENVQWQQQGREFGYELHIEDRNYVAWMNPYPLLPNHMVIASREHLPQTWRVNGSEHPTKSLRTIVTDLLTLASRLPGWIGFYNGAGAGASIPNHFHYQFMPRPDDYGPFPLERAAAGKRPSSCVLDDAYPLEFAHWHGNIEDLLDQAVPWLNAWVRADGAELTANVIAIAGECTRELDLYFVPRDPNRSGSAVMSGSIGGLEVLGELIFSNEEERQRLEDGDIDCATVESILSSIAVAIR